MTTFTATTDAQGRFVTLAVTDLDAASVVSITRDPSPGSIAVRGTPKEIPAAGATVLTDVEFPYGTEITYTATLRDPSTNATLETLTETVPAISLPERGMVVSNPLTNRQVTLTAIDQREESSEFRGFRYNLSGRTQPLYLTEEHAGWTWVNEWLTETLSDRQTLDDLLRHRQPVLLRTEQDCDLRNGWVIPEQIRVTRFSIPASDTRRRWEVEVGEVEPPESTVETVAVTLESVHEYEPTTLQALHDRPPTTLLDLSLTVTASA